MLVAMQFPFAEARAFLPTPSYRLDRPVWPLPEPGKDFVRRFGAVSQSESGGVENWPGEGSYCRATNAIRFERSVDEFLKAYPAVRQNFGGVFRRFVYDGLAVSRIEVGFGQRQLTTNSAPQRDDQWIVLLRDVAAMSVRVPSANGAGDKCKILDAPNRLAAAYLESTTQITTGQRKPTERWWFTPGLPLLLIAHRETRLGLAVRN